jgi:DNA-binding NarL/FixJ family response regulator
LDSFVTTITPDSNGNGKVKNGVERAIRIFVIDDQSLMRDGLVGLLTNQADFEMVGTAESAVHAVDQISRLKPDVVLLGWPGNSAGSQRIFTTVRDGKLASRIILLTSEGGRDDQFEAVRQGCCGIVPRSSATEMLLKSIRRVHAGELWLDRMTSAEIIRRFARKNGGPALPTPVRQGNRDQGNSLSQREREIVSLVAQGFKNKEMAERMFISEQTVKNHLHNIFDKLGVSDRLELALYAIHNNLHES